MNNRRGLVAALILVAGVRPARAEVPLIGCDGALATVFAPTPSVATGHISWGPSVTARTLRAAYLNGIYPMDTAPLAEVGWYSPPQRGVLFFDEVRISRSDRKALRRDRGRCRVLIDERSREIIAKCKRPLVARAGEWLTDRLVEGYHEAFDENLAHSFATVDGDRLTGGLFGIYAGYFSGDSMFHDEDDAAKLAFYALIENLRANGHTFIDVQQAFPADARGRRSLAVKWGAREIPRADFLELIRRTQVDARAFGASERL